MIALRHMPVRQCTGGDSGGRCESIKRKREPDHARATGPGRWCWVLPACSRPVPRARAAVASASASGQDPDPATVDFPIFYIRHQIPEDQDDVTRVRPFVEDDDYSATLWKRDRASPGAPETEITARLRVEPPLGEPEDRYDIKDLAVSPDGLHVAFAMRGPLDDVDERTSRRPGTSGNTTSRPTRCTA